ncbi:MAG: CBS domain-containing protein [Rhodospirillaceae bacterium]
MVETYQAPMRQDKEKKKRTLTQTVSSNSAGARSVVGSILDQKNNPNTITIKPSDTLGHAVEILRDHGIGALVVTNDHGDLCGILSERDIVRKLADTPGRTLPQLVSDIMVKNVITCGREDDLVSVLVKMRDGRFRHMPVVVDGKPVGMVSIGDVIHFRLTEVEHEALQLKQLIVG